LKAGQLDMGLSGLFFGKPEFSHRGILARSRRDAAHCRTLVIVEQEETEGTEEELKCVLHILGCVTSALSASSCSNNGFAFCLLRAAQCSSCLRVKESGKAICTRESRVSGEISIELIGRKEISSAASIPSYSSSY